MKDDAITVADAGPGSQTCGCDEAWQPPESLRALAADGCGSLIVELIAMFRTDTDSRLRTVDDAIAKGDFPLVRKQIHCLKGAASQLGAGKMAALCAQIESSGPETLAQDLPAKLKMLRAVYERAVCAMEASSFGAPGGGASQSNDWDSSAV
jgi:HPt (histidine-containing phosphotransfer) domain-containing protein